MDLWCALLRGSSDRRLRRRATKPPQRFPQIFTEKYSGRKIAWTLQFGSVEFRQNKTGDTGLLVIVDHLTKYAQNTRIFDTIHALATYDTLFYPTLRLSLILQVDNFFFVFSHHLSVLDEKSSSERKNSVKRINSTNINLWLVYRSVRMRQ